MNRFDLVFILPSLDKSTHFSHTINLLNKLAQNIRLLVIVEKGKSINFDFSSYYINEPNYLKRLIKTFKIIKKCRDNGCIHFYSHYSFFGALSIGLVTKLFGGVSYYWNCGEPHKFFKNYFQLDKLGLQLSLFMTDYLITGTPLMKEYYANIFKKDADEILIIPNDISLSEFKYNYKIKKDDMVLFVHHLTPRKGADQIAKVAKVVLSKLPNTKFRIIGDGSYMEILVKEVEYIGGGINYDIQLLGKLNNIEVQDYFNNATILFVPSLEEGMPRVILEAMASQTCVVSYDVGGISDMVGSIGNKYLVSQGNYEEMGNKIVKLLNSRSERDRLIREQNMIVKNYDTNKIIGMWLNLLDIKTKNG